MSIFNKTLTIDFGNSSDIPEIKLVQGEEDARVIHLKLADGNTAVNLTGCTARIYILPCGETTPLYEDLTVTSASSGKCDYTVSGNAAAIAGSGQYWIEVIQTGSPDPVLVGYSLVGKITVTAKPDFTGAIIASTVFSALSTALSTVQTYLSRIVALETADAQNFKLSGNQSAAGNKTFTGITTFSQMPVFPGSAWTDIDLTGTGWTGQAKYKKAAGVVYVWVYSLTRSTTKPGAIPIGVLPAGFRPTLSVFSQSFAENAPTGSYIRVLPEGTLDVYSAVANYYYFAHFSYLAEG